MELPPLSNSTTLAPEYYLGPEWYRFDLKRVLASGWQVVAPASCVAKIGDVIVREIAEVPVVILRNSSGLAGFLNICAHRGGPLATGPASRVEKLRCGYHGWTYNLNGELIVAPQMAEAEAFDISCVRLTAIEVQEIGGMVFARLEPGEPFTDVMRGVTDVAGADCFVGLAHHSSHRYRVGANWKIYVDNYLEGYHLPFVHPDLTKILTYAEYQTVLGEWWSLQRSPVSARDGGPYQSGEGLYFFIYPNTMLNIMPGRLQTNRVVPTGISTCEVEFDFYYAGDTAALAEEDLRFSEQVQDEDRVICEHVQRAYQSGRYQPGRLSPARESGVWHWHNLLRRAYGDSVPDSS